MFEPGRLDPEAFGQAERALRLDAPRITRAEEVETAWLVRCCQRARKLGFEREARDCYERLDARYRARVVALVKPVVRDHAEAEAVANEALLRMWQQLDRYRPIDQLSFWRWLRRIALNRALTHVARGLAPDPTDPFALSLRCELLRSDGEPVAERFGAAVSRSTDWSLAELTHARLAELVARLTEAQRQVLIVRFGWGLSVEAAADVLGSRAENVRALQHRALERLRAELSGRRDAGEVRVLRVPMLARVRSSPVTGTRRLALWGSLDPHLACRRAA